MDSSWFLRTKEILQEDDPEDSNSSAFDELGRLGEIFLSPSTMTTNQTENQTARPKRAKRKDTQRIHYATRDKKHCYCEAEVPDDDHYICKSRLFRSWVMKRIKLGFILPLLCMRRSDLASSWRKLKQKVIYKHLRKISPLRNQFKWKQGSCCKFLLRELFSKTSSFSSKLVFSSEKLCHFDTPNNM